MNLLDYPQNFSKRQRLITDDVYQGRRLFPNGPLGTEYNSGLYNNTIPGQVATNFIGMKYIRPPPDDSRQYSKGRPWNPLDYNIPILTTPLVQRQYNVNCG